MYLPFETTSAIFVGGLIRGVADILARRRKLSPAAAEGVEQRGTLLASGFIAGEAILAIVLSTAFIIAERMKFPEFSVTRWITGHAELPLLQQYGAPLSLIVFAVVAMVLIRGPLRRGLPE
jgi:hypothetical protein